MTKSKFQRRHYEAVAELLGRRLALATSDAEYAGVDATAFAFIDMFERDNGNFKAQRFYNAVLRHKDNNTYDN